MEERYNRLNTYYKNKFGERTLKICIDGGFTCPNRDGRCGNGGCIFCSEKGSGELIGHGIEKDSVDLIGHGIENQVKEYFASYRAKRANKFIVYFQNFSNTYDTIQNLKSKYDSALIDERIVGISIATRPDCINDEIASLISSYKNKYYVCVELGLQTSDNEIGKIINRGYSTEEFIKAVEILNKYNIDIIVHIMCGLPGEDRKKGVSEQIKDTVNLINKLDIDGIKIHSTYVVKNTKLCEMYENGQYIPLSLDEYLDDLIYVITHIKPQIVVHRICADAPKDILIAPEWNAHKKIVMNRFNKIMEEQDLRQGMYFQTGTVLF